MADQLIDMGNGTFKRMQDMGDGTFAEVVAMAGGGGGVSYTLPVATAAALGGIKSSATVNVAAGGVASVPLGTTAAPGVLQPDGTTITVDAAGKISAVASGGGGGAAESFAVLGFASVTTPTIAANALTGGVANPASAACNCVLIRNDSGEIIEFNRNGGTAYARILPFEYYPVFGIANANELGFRLRNYSGTRDSLRVPVALTLINTSLNYPCVQLTGGTATSNVYTALAAQACVAAEVRNASNKAVLVKVGTGVMLLKRAEVVVLDVTNTNQISVVSPDNIGLVAVYVQAFTAIKPGPGAPQRKYTVADAISPTNTLMLDDMQNGPFEQPMGLADLAPFKKRQVKRRVISLFTNAASINVTAGLSKADVALASEQVFANYGATSNSGGSATPSAPNVTFTTDTTASVTTNNNTPAAIDVTGGAIHVTVQKVTPTTGGFTAMNIDLFSSGTPAAPGADFHTLNIFPDISGGMTFLNAYGSRSYGVNLFAAVGAGANLSAITFARIRIAGAFNMAFIPGDISFVPNASAKASIVFSIDDNHGKTCWDALRILSPYGYPVVLYMSPVTKVVGGNGNTDGNPTVDQLVALERRYGWQIASQDYWDGGLSDIDRTPNKWVAESRKNFYMAAQNGFDLDGMRDGSMYGGYTYGIDGPISKAMERIFATNRRFDNGSGTPGDGNAPFGFADTNPPGDPYNMRAYNMDTYIQAGATVQQTYDKMKAYVDQAVANKGIAILSTHTGFSDGVVGAAIAQIAAYIRTLEIAGTAEVVTMQQLRNRSQ